ncbi:MAG: tetratricopeptide repeat protein [Myxococcales bacterium]|nr:tetratricopeptide repeat protein [Myxococcales bacterium]
MITTNSGSVPPTLSSDAKEALYAMGHSLFSQDRYVQAAELFRIMLRLCPEDERSWLALGECHAQVGQEQIALQLYTTAVSALPTAGRCALARFRTLRALGEDAEADEALEVARRLAEDSADEDLAELVEREGMKS